MKSSLKAFFLPLPVLALSGLLAADAQTVPASTNRVVPPAPPVTQLDAIVVTGSLDTERDRIAPDLGATVYTITPSQIETQSQGENAPFNQTLLRAPGVAEDSFGQLHIRGEHANLQYRINDVLIPEGLTGFGQELDTRFLSNVSLITGALPAQYGFHTAGIIDVQDQKRRVRSGRRSQPLRRQLRYDQPELSRRREQRKVELLFHRQLFGKRPGHRKSGQQHQPAS